MAGAERAGERLKVARAAPAEGEAHAGAFEIRRGFERSADVAEGAAFGSEETDGVVTRLDFGTVPRRAGELRSQQACPRGRHRAVDRGEQRAFAAAGVGPVDLQAGAGRGVDQQRAAGLAALRHGEARGAAGLGQLHIVEQQAGGSEFCLREVAEPIEGGDTEGFLQKRLAGLRGARTGGAFGDRRGRHFAKTRERRTVPVGLRDDQFAERPGEQSVRDARGVECRQFKQAGRDIAHGERGLALPRESQRSKRLALPSGQQGLLGQRTGRDDAHDFAPDDGFRAAFFRLRRALGLLADGDPAAGLDQPGQIPFRSVIGHARHRDRRPVMFAP